MPFLLCKPPTLESGGGGSSGDCGSHLPTNAKLPVAAMIYDTKKYTQKYVFFI